MQPGCEKANLATETTVNHLIFAASKFGFLAVSQFNVLLSYFLFSWDVFSSTLKHTVPFKSCF